MMKFSLETLINKYKIEKIENPKINKSGIYELVVNKNINIEIQDNLDVIIKINNKLPSLNISMKMGKNTKVGYYVINDSRKVITNIDIGESSFLEVYNYYFNDCITKTIINLKEYKAKVSYNIGLNLNNKDESIHETKINHLAEYTDSNISKKAVIDGTSKCVIDIQSYIKKQAHHANAYQKSNIITLSEKARASIKPILLIDDYDIIGGHGATISKINNDDLYYMATRGIPKQQAIKLLTFGFLMENVPKFMYNDIENLLKEGDIYE